MVRLAYPEQHPPGYKFAPTLGSGSGVVNSVGRSGGGSGSDNEELHAHKDSVDGPQLARAPLLSSFARAESIRAWEEAEEGGGRGSSFRAVTEADAGLLSSGGGGGSYSRGASEAPLAPALARGPSFDAGAPAPLPAAAVAASGPPHVAPAAPVFTGFRRGAAPAEPVFTGFIRSAAPTADTPVFSKTYGAQQQPPPLPPSPSRALPQEEAPLPAAPAAAAAAVPPAEKETTPIAESRADGSGDLGEGAAPPPEPVEPPPRAEQAGDGAAAEVGDDDILARAQSQLEELRGGGQP
jgi:hypothetical protein